MSAVVEARDLTVSFGPVVAVDGFDLTVPARATLALVGRNGAGKSTTLKVLAGVLPPTSGDVRIAGIDSLRHPDQARARVGYCPDVGGLIPRATPWEHLQLAATLRSMHAGWEKRAEDLLDRFDLLGVSDRVTAGFSHGMGRRMSVVLAAFHEPEVLLLDEPFDGVDPLGVEATMDVIRELRAMGAAVLVSTHLLELAVEACEQAVVLRRGRVVAAAPAIELHRGRGRSKISITADLMSPAENIPAHRQLLALLRLRLQMIRSRPIRWGIALLTILPAGLVVAGLLGMQTLPDDQTSNLSLAAPTFYVGFLVLAVLAPLVSGGGYALYPSDQLVAYPIRPATAFHGTLLLAPVNLAWVINVVALFVITGFTTGDLAWAPTSRSLVTVAAFVLAATAFGHTIGWLVMGFRQSRAGRFYTNVAGVLALVAGLFVFWTDNVITLLDNSPTTRVLTGASDGYDGSYQSWLMVVGILVIAIGVFLRVGDAVASWSFRRPGDHADRTSSRSLPRREWSRSVTHSLLMVDHASVWRSTPLRRGVLVLVLVPGVISALAGMTWQSLILVPGLIAAGAGLLFGINAFTIDSSGSVWLSTLPGWVSSSYLSKSIVFFEVAIAAVLSALIGGSIRAQPPTAMSEVAAALMSALCCAVLVVALGMRSSLRHPQRADLKGPRDTPATPGVMAAQSMRLALATTITSLFFATIALSGIWWVPLVGALPVLLLSTLYWHRTGLAWAHPHVRAAVVSTVAGG